MEENLARKKDKKMLWTLFKSNFLLSSFTFGGGFVIVSLMKKKYVEELKWLDEDEMMDITAIAQSSPGPIPVNASVILGYRMFGILGSVVAILGTILPPMIVISVISFFYEQFRTNPIVAVALQVMRAGVAAVIFDVVINLAMKVLGTKRTLYLILMIASFIAVCFFSVDAAFVILFCLAVGIADVCVDLVKKHRGKDGKQA